jgi:prepilin-type N-terminal cleavage/methylation domain-containing protein
MKLKKIQKNNLKFKKGFTLVEAMVAIFILTVALSAMLGLTANSVFDARYARNEIVANYLLQEAADYIRNDRDTIAFQHNGGGDWTSFLNKYGYNNGVGSNTCFVLSSALPTSTDGCYLEPADAIPVPSLCNTSPVFGSSRCPLLYFDPDAINNDFYNYHGTGTESNFKRQILMSISPSNPDELWVKVNLEWKNGNLVKSRSLQLSLLKWLN